MYGLIGMLRNWLVYELVYKLVYVLPGLLVTCIYMQTDTGPCTGVRMFVGSLAWWSTGSHVS